MKRIRLIISYDGTNYVGWQVQKNGLAVEQVINEHLSKLLGEEITIIGASRTDSGVHALGNVAIFDTETRIPPEKIALAANQSLPDDIKIVRSEEVPSDFHPRYANCRKTYQYNILNSRVNLPLKDYIRITYIMNWMFPR
jgi:tRNA pseudouridine38-40 synthase